MEFLKIITALLLISLAHGRILSNFPNPGKTNDTSYIAVGYFDDNKELETTLNLNNLTRYNELDHFQVQKYNGINSKRFKRWGWRNPVDFVTNTFNDAKKNVEKAVFVVKSTGENAVHHVTTNVGKAVEVVKNTGQNAVGEVKTKAEKAFVVVQNTGQNAVDEVKTNSEKAVVAIQNTGQDVINTVESNVNTAIVVISETGKDALDKVKKNTANVIYIVSRFSQKSVVDVSNLAQGSIHVVKQNGEDIIVAISKNTIDPLKKNVEIIINDEATMKLIRNAAFEGSCALLGTVGGVPGAIATGVACEVLRQMMEHGPDAVLEKVKNGDAKFISHVVLKGACAGISSKVFFVGGAVTEEVCTIIEVIIDEGIENVPALVEGDYKYIFENKINISGACGGIGTMGGKKGAVVTAVGCSVANDLNDEGKI